MVPSYGDALYYYFWVKNGKGIQVSPPPTVHSPSFTGWVGEGAQVSLLPAQWTAPPQPCPHPQRIATLTLATHRIRSSLQCCRVPWLPAQWNHKLDCGFARRCHTVAMCCAFPRRVPNAPRACRSNLPFVVCRFCQRLCYAIANVVFWAEVRALFMQILSLFCDRHFHGVASSRVWALFAQSRRIAAPTLFPAITTLSYSTPVRIGAPFLRILSCNANPSFGLLLWSLPFPFRGAFWYREPQIFGSLSAVLILKKFLLVFLVLRFNCWGALSVSFIFFSFYRFEVRP